jgi:hypothetical protein
VKTQHILAKSAILLVGFKKKSHYKFNHHQQTKYHLSLIHSSFFPNDLTAVPFQLPRSSWSSVSGTALAELIRQMANVWVQHGTAAISMGISMGILIALVVACCSYR